jgi:L-aminopeptidase/D-esterase-like protein
MYHLILAPLLLAGSGLTKVPGIKVGHFTLEERPTGCTVVLVEAGAVAGADVRGGAPGTREIDLLSPVATVERVHAIVLSGGSAFGLDAASGTVRFLEERGIGFDVGVAKVPIVPAAILFDLGVGGRPDIRPGASCGFNAASAATDGPVAEGSIGAGAGATVGKLAGRERAMKGGIGTAAIELPNGLVVAALVAVNAVGDVIDPATGRVVAGVRTEDGRGLADARKLLRSGSPQPERSASEASREARAVGVGPHGIERSPLGGRPGENTTIGVVATNARLTKAQAMKMAQMAHDGLARAIVPAHTPMDGDTLFALALGSFEGEANLSLLGALAADATAEAILSAARSAESAGGFPAARDLETGSTR